MRVFRQRPSVLLAWACVIATFGFWVAGNALRGATPDRLIPADELHQLNGWWLRLSFLYELAFAIVGALIIARRPGNRIGWVCCGIGLLTSLYQLILGYSTFGAAMNHSLPGLPFVQWLASWEWVLAVILALYFLPLLFPDGKPISPAWWLSAPLAIGGFALAFWLHFVGELIAVAGSLAANVSLAIRYRRAAPDERQQIRWFAVALIFVALVSVTGVIVGSAVYGNTTVVFNPYFDVLTPLALTGLAASIGIAVLRYHLYDIDLFIRQALVYGTLVVIISVAYFMLVVGVGSHIWGVRQGDPGGAVALGALIALVFQPARRFVARLANRLVYGKRATPYEVLSQFSQQVGGMYASDDLPRRMAQVLAEGTNADRATVWLRVGSELREAASWPAGSSERQRLLLLDGQLPVIPEAADAVPVQYQGELLGALAIAKREPLTAIERRLLSDLGHESGLVLKNARLTAELVQRLDELKASRERLVTAQDTERRRIERNIHDGAQQNLVALKIKLALAKNQAVANPALAQSMLDELSNETSDAIETLRELARGLYPPVLAQEGLIAAIDAQARRMPIDVQVIGGPLPRYPQETEASVYFCVLEALQNVVKHSGARNATVRFDATADHLSFEVSDDGHGLDPARARTGSGLQNMRDRVEVLGGELRVESAPGKGTRVSGVLPVGSAPEALAGAIG